MSEDKSNAPRAGQLFKHADGGRYKVVRPCKIKHPETGEWLNGVAYEALQGDYMDLYATTLERWEERFTAEPMPSAKEAMLRFAETIRNLNLSDEEIDELFGGYKRED